ncbi:GNAT family N-acetyltransferase [Candidatus Bathyarchaeota archaeon]|nr:GNAT family N-acetyltransferase [Candidatus Bathyarchaeota archaeon]
MDVRDARDDDVPGFIQCYRKIWESLRGILPHQYVEEVIEEAGQPALSDRIRTAIADPERIMLVAEEGGEIVGLAQGRTNRGGYSWLGFMGVSPDHRRRGVGGGLLDVFIRRSRESGCTKVSLDTAPSLKPAIKLYAETGFIPEGYMRNHMHGLDLIFYSLFL